MNIDVIYRLLFISDVKELTRSRFEGRAYDDQV
jgi:hypothetical protein